MQPGEGSSGMATTRSAWRRLHEERGNATGASDHYDPDARAERLADAKHTENPGRQEETEQLEQDVPVAQANDPDIDPLRAPNGPGIHGASAAKDYPTMQRAMHHGFSTKCTYKRVLEHVIPSATPSRKKFTAQVKADFIEPVPVGARGNPLNQHEFAKHMTPHHTCWIKSDGLFVLPQLCPAMVQNDHYIHMLGACSRSRIITAYETIIPKELITYHTTNHDTDTQQVLSTKQPSLIMLQTDANNLPTMPQWLILIDTENHDNERYDWMRVQVGCGLNQQYPNNEFKTSAAHDRKIEILPTYDAIFSTAIARKKETLV